MNDRKKSIVIISPYIPWPLSSGGNVGVFYMLSGLCKKVDITFISCFNKTNTRHNLNELEKRLPNIDFRIFDYKTAKNHKFEWAKKIVRFIDLHVPITLGISKVTMNVLQEITPDFLHHVNQVVTEKQADIVQVEFYEYLPLVCALPDNVKKIFIHHELRFVVNELRFGNDNASIFLKRYLKANEINLLNQYDIVAPLTDIDLLKLKNAGVVRDLHTSTLAISNETHPYRKQKFTNRLTFIGGDGHNPNKDGIFWFVENIVPLIVKENSDIVLDIIGCWSEENKKKILRLSQNVHFLGFVDNLGDVLYNSIMIVPIRIGSGMRMKILEAASYSVPIVTTSIGIEGLDFADKEECCIADSPKDIAKSILELAEDNTLYQNYSRRIYNKFIDKYSVEALCNIRLSLYN